jgi:NADH:ubiquinone oxidoreductase subunit 4 (subunit M)
MGSIILAGVLLKLGGMGLFIFRKWSILSFNFLGIIFLRFCLYGILVVGFICFYQNDIKVLVAFSRVNHMRLVIFRILCGGRFSILGGIIIIIGHGLASSLLFFLVRISYSQSGNRLLITLGQGSSRGTILFF